LFLHSAGSNSLLIVHSPILNRPNSIMLTTRRQILGPQARFISITIFV
jgi:hypothetical protein